MKPKLNQKKLAKMIEEATTDCHDEYEAIEGFVVTMEDKLKVPFDAKMLGEDITVVEINSKGNRIVARIKKGSKHYIVDILDMEDIKNVKNSEWIEAYRQWRGSW
ncbi:MAG: hypothetical protein HY513_00865 [Candidatus Aenigmarchaeota archaeon]|nr:hypothetical protein [Candidatus Aenigmarchaeota archaeon]